MNRKTKLADDENILVKETAQRLTQGEEDLRKKLEKLFYYVRDDIKFAFPKDGDLVKASETIQSGRGQCNTKSTLFLALCKSMGIPARIHFSLIKKEIQQGLFTGIAYHLMPDLISHSWIEVKIEGKWRRLDSYINDEDFYLAAKSELKKNGWDTGFSVACSSGESSSGFHIDEEKFVQMDAVVLDHGVWDEPMDYYTTDKYNNRPSLIKLILYRILINGINKKVAQMRKKCSGGLCGY